MAQEILDGKVLITGASGFIGARLQARLLDEGADVVTIRRPGSPMPKEGRSVEVEYADESQLQEVIAAERPDYLLHVAGVTKGSSYADFREGNVVPTRNLLAATRRGHPTMKRFVLVSSLAAYGPSATTARQRESNPPRPIEHYGRSKLEAEKVVEEEAADVAWTIVRPCAVYGPGDADHFSLFQAAMLGLNIFYGNRDRRMSWIYVDDCVRGIVAAAAHRDSIGKSYFLTHDPPRSWDDFQTEVALAVGRPVRTIDLPETLMWAGAFMGEIATRLDKKPRLLNLQKARLAVQDAWTCSGDAARKDIGFIANVGLSEGVPKTHQWYLERNWYRSLNPKELLSKKSLGRLVGHLRRGG